MWRVLVLKELRETGGIALLGLIALLGVASTAMRVNLYPLGFYTGGAIPLVSDGFLFAFAFVSLVLAVALGLRQSWGESLGSTYQFLLHLPVSRLALCSVKIGVGTAICLVSAALAIVLVSHWAAAPGTHASPFQWSMTWPFWKLWLSLPLVYLGAFLSGLRPARWLGTRLLPLIASCALLPLLVFALPWWQCGLTLLMLATAAFAIAVIHVMESRDFG